MHQSEDQSSISAHKTPSDRQEINALISKHGFKDVVQELRDFALQNESELGLPQELKTYWGRVSELLEQVLKIEEVEDYEPLNE